MAPDIEDMIDHLLKTEGGYVNDPDDPGGPTNFGITQTTLSRWRDRPVSAAEVRGMSVSEARDIYRHRYFKRPRIDALPHGVQPSVFDMFVNAGGNGIKILQRTLREFDEEVSVDGALGPQSIGAAKRVEERAGALLRNAYGLERVRYYYRIATRNPRLRKFAERRSGAKGGWITRAEMFMDDRFHVSQAQHDEFTEAWT